MKNFRTCILKSLVSAIGILSITSSIVLAEGGGDTGGASQVSENNAPPILLDFAAVGVTNLPNTPAPSFIVLSEMYKYLDIEFLYLKDNRSYIEAKDSLKRNFKNFPKLKSLIHYTMNTMRMAGVNFPLKTPKEVEIPFEFKNKDKKVDTLVFYDKFFGGIININLFNNLGFLSQAGVWIHEALRRLQLTYHFSVTNSEMFKITSAAFEDSLKDSGYFLDNETKDLLLRLEKELVNENPYTNISSFIYNHLCKGETLKDKVDFRSQLTLCDSSSSYLRTNDFEFLIKLIGDQIIKTDEYRSSSDLNSRERNFYDNLRNELENMLFDLGRETPSGSGIWDDFPKGGESFNIVNYFSEYEQIKIHQDPKKIDNWSGIKELKAKIIEYLKAKYSK